MNENIDIEYILCIIGGLIFWGILLPIFILCWIGIIIINIGKNYRLEEKNEKQEIKNNLFD